jgi:hypothetical protein
MNASLSPSPQSAPAEVTAEYHTALLNFKFRLYPTKEQELALEQTLDGCRPNERL